MTGMLERAALLAQPPEMFQTLFGGRTPTLAEKMQFVEAAIQRMTALNIYENNLYHVKVTYSQPFIHLSITRHDGGSCNEWRHFQQIKNELVGPEHEAVELFPAEVRLVDIANEYHLWVCVDPAYRFPFGFQRRVVTDKPTVERFSIDVMSSAVGCGHGIRTDRILPTEVAESSTVEHGFGN